MNLSYLLTCGHIISQSFVKWLSKLIFSLFQKPKMGTKSPYFPNPNCVQSLSSMKNGINFNLIGQCLDKLWIFLSNLCPSAMELGVGSTQFWQDMDIEQTDSLPDRFLDRPWTGIGRGLDRHWILRPVPVQPTIVDLYQILLYWSSIQRRPFAFKDLPFESEL